MKKEIWIIVQHDSDAVDESAFGLIAEARRIISEAGGTGSVTSVLMGTIEDDALALLKQGGADKIIHIKHDALDRYHGELFAKVFFEAVEKNAVSCIFVSQNESYSDFAPRLAALMNAPLVTRTMDFRFDEQGRGIAMRPVQNGYLFDKVIINTDTTSIISFLPSVLSSVSDFEKSTDTPVEEIVPDIDENCLKTKVVKNIKADPENLEIEDAEIVVAGGRGVGKNDAFNIIHELAKVIGGSVGGTRPVIDSQLLPFERQIGQTGKTIIPDLIINCGISGANEYSAGMEKSKNVIAINKDPRARIFRFSDLSVVGDLKGILPLLIEKMRKIKEGQ